VLLVIDTNVLLSGLLWHGPPHALLGKVRDGVADLVLSPALIAELADVIARPKFAAILAHSSRTPERILAELRSLVDIVAAPPLPRPICRDPDDDAVLACALAARADLIVSGDDDLRVLAMFKNIPIVAAAEALARLDR
jgi:putative PIN family toxin of toxin-antitoxin system